MIAHTKKSNHEPRRSGTLARPPSISTLAITLLITLTILAQTAAASSPLEQAESLLANPATARQCIATLSREMQSRDPSRAVAAAIMLAQHLRTHGETAKAVTALEPYGGFTPEKLQEAVLPAYLERARCLAADARIREAVKALDFAKEKTQGHQRARVFAAYADMHGIAKEWPVAIKQYQAALAYGDKYFTRKKTKESVEVVLGPVVPGTDTWKKTYRPPIVASLRHSERQYEIEQYGEGFVDYRDARTAHLDKKYQSAIAQYNTLAEKHTGTVYAEAAQFYRFQCQADTGNQQAAIQSLETFIKADPLGLYRGEALYETGRLQLEQGDVDKAERAFNQTLEWIPRVRTQERDLKLYALPQKAAKIAAPPEAAQRLANQILQSANITPAMVINRRTAPWYLTRLEWDTRYYLGFIAFYHGKHDQALAHFTRAFETNESLQKQYHGHIGSFHRRLQSACHWKVLLARPEEMRAYGQPERLRFMLADFHALWEKWDLAEPVYREFLDNPRSSRDVKASALRALGFAAQQQDRWEEAKRYYHKIIEEYERAPSAQIAMLQLGKENSATIAKKAELLTKAHEMNPNSRTGESALYNLGFMYRAYKMPQESIKAFNRFKQRYPQSRFMGHVNKFIEQQQE